MQFLVPRPLVSYVYAACEERKSPVLPVLSRHANIQVGGCFSGSEHFLPRFELALI